MSSTSYNFKDNLTIDNNKFLKWIDSTGTTRSNIISMDSTNNVNLNSGKADININSNNTAGSYTFINVNNPYNTIIDSKLAVGFHSTENMNANITVVKNGYIGTNAVDGFIGLSSSYNLDSVQGSKILLYGAESTAGNGDVVLCAGGAGSVKMSTNNDSLKMKIGNDGVVQFSPNGTTIRCDISDNQTTFDHFVRIISTAQALSANTGALQVAGGIGISGNCFIDGTLSINSLAGGNINFDSSQESTSYTTGAIFLSGGLGIANSKEATSITSGGGISVAGGVAVGKNR